MTFYEQELRKLFADGTVIGSPKFTGRACLGTLGKDLRARVQFVTSGHADHYDVISVTVLNRTDGVVDKLRLRLKDILGVKQVPGNPNFRNGVAPHIWEDSGKAEWYAFRPSAADYSAMRQETVGHKGEGACNGVSAGLRRAGVSGTPAHTLFFWVVWFVR